MSEEDKKEIEGSSEQVSPENQKKAPAKETPAEEESLAEEPVKEPSPSELYLQSLVQTLREKVATDAVTDAFINETNGSLPTLVVANPEWHSVAAFLKSADGYRFDYLRSLTGIDFENEMEVVYHLLSLTTKQQIAVKVKTERENASVPSVTDVWISADWQEREVYDLLGIDFPGHPNLQRIMMPDDWVGHPLRKDYEPLDEEV